MSISVGTRVEVGLNRLGQVIRQEQKMKQDGYVVTPLNPGPGDGTAPRWYPADQVFAADMSQWEYITRTNRYIRVVDVDAG